MARYLDPRSDVVFKKVFGEHPNLLKSFLNALLPLPDDQQIVSLEYLPSEQAPRVPTLKRPIVDVKCKDAKGRIFIVEMQMEWTDGFTQRLLFNAASAYVKQLPTGEHYRSLCPVYGLALINENYTVGPDWYHHYKLVKEKREGEEPLVLQGLELIFLELLKFPIKTTEEKHLKILWLRFLRELKNRTSAIDPDLLAIAEIQEAIALTEESGYTVAELESYDRYWDSVSTEKTLLTGKFQEGMAEGIEKGKAEGITEGIEKGKTEGIAEGIEKGKIERSRTLACEMILDNESDAKIIKYTGLTLSEIIEIKKSII